MNFKFLSNLAILGSILVFCACSEKAPSATVLISSSSEEQSSISSVSKSSSSMALSSSRLSTWCNTLENCGTFIDMRDGKSYNWTKIGAQVWMAENLDFGDRVSGTDNQMDASITHAEKYCYGDNDANCTTYGGLYSWHTVMALPFTCNSNPVDTEPCNLSIPHHRGICPEGWHVPTQEEWATLDAWVDADNGGFINDEGSSLKSTTLWDSGVGTDAYGWMGLPGGSRYLGRFLSQGYSGGWWSASQHDANNAWYHYLFYGYAYLYENKDESYSGYSLRCIQD